MSLLSLTQAADGGDVEVWAIFSWYPSLNVKMRSLHSDRFNSHQISTDDLWNVVELEEDKSEANM